MIDREKMLRWLEGQGAIEEIDRDCWSNHLDTEKAREFRNRASANISIIEAIRSLIRAAPDAEYDKAVEELAGEALEAAECMEAEYDPTHGLGIRNAIAAVREAREGRGK